ncbi:hypothetical protein [Agromyces neolithicus]|uniref:Uncharacterized protein n=1 Tax=Agromyces neolithicus TaxID=269420 RepID=A0ABN2MEF4_9MICO
MNHHIARGHIVRLAGPLGGIVGIVGIVESIASERPGGPRDAVIYWPHPGTRTTWGEDYLERVELPRCPDHGAVMALSRYGPSEYVWVGPCCPDEKWAFSVAR